MTRPYTDPKLSFTFIRDAEDQPQHGCHAKIMSRLISHDLREWNNAGRHCLGQAKLDVLAAIVLFLHQSGPELL